MRKGPVKITMAAAAAVLFWMFGLRTAEQGTAGSQVVLRFGMMAGSYWEVPTGNCYQIIDDAIRRFEKEHPGVEVSYVSGILKEDYPEWLAEQVLLGKEPDVFMIPEGEFDMLASIGGLMELGGLIEKDGEFDPQKYYQGPWEYGRMGDGQFALPYESVPTLMFVNKTLLDQEGIPVPDSSWTWEDFLAICRQVTKDTDGDGITDQFGFYDYGWQDGVCANGTVLFDGDGSASYFGDERVEEAVRFVKELEETNQGFTVTSREFDLGKVAFMPLAYSEYRTYKPYPWRIKKYSDFTWDCVKMPSGPHGDGGSRMETLLMGIGKGSRRPELAWEFLKTLCYEGETQRQIMRESQGASVLREMVRSSPEEAGQEGGLSPMVLDQVMEEAVAAPSFRDYPSAMEMADMEIQRMLRGETSLDTGLLKLQREINRYLSQ